MHSSIALHFFIPKNWFAKPPINVCSKKEPVFDLVTKAHISYVRDYGLKTQMRKIIYYKGWNKRSEIAWPHYSISKKKKNVCPKSLHRWTLLSDQELRENNLYYYHFFSFCDITNLNIWSKRSPCPPDTWGTI